MPAKDRGVIDKDIASIEGKRVTVEKFSNKSINIKRKAVTKWEVLEKFKDHSLLSVSPVTGRTHQIRVHLASIGHPILCDKIYSGKKVCPEKLGRLFLHAYYLKIPYKNNTIFEFETELPGELLGYLNELRKS